MASTMRPQGPLPARVYWIRRLVVLAVPVLLVVVLARVLGGSSDGKDADGTATQAGAQVETTETPTLGPTAAAGAGDTGKKGRKKREQETPAPPPEPVLPEPSGPCDDSDIVATPAITSAPGGSDIAIAAKSQNQELAQKAVALMLSDDYQTIMAENGLTPAKNSLTSLLGDDAFAQATIAAASNAKLTPAAPGWATVEGSRVLEDMFSAIAQGGDVAELAAKADEQMNPQLNG